jgi:hypothetical protein
MIVIIEGIQKNLMIKSFMRMWFSFVYLAFRFAWLCRANQFLGQNEPCQFHCNYSYSIILSQVHTKTRKSMANGKC